MVQKASEGSLRDEFNGKFARVDGKERDEVQVKDDSGNNVYNVKYALDSENRSASIKKVIVKSQQIQKCRIYNKI